MANRSERGFEDTLWETADKLRNNLDAAEYKHVVLGLVFLNYIQSARGFRVPAPARWEALARHARQPDIGKRVDAAMEAIEQKNPSLRGVLPRDYARTTLDPRKLGELVDLVGSLGLEDPESRGKDILGRVYEYFLAKFARAEGKNGGQFYTPKCVVKLLVEMLAPYRGRVYDPCCGSGGMFVQSERFLEEHGGKRGDISIYGQESNPTTWRLARMNLAIRGIEHDLGPGPADSFHQDLHPELKADFILTNPPFNVSDWGGERLRHDARWKYGVPPEGNANFAWVQHFLHHLSPQGVAGVVLANGSMSSTHSGEGEIRQALVEAELVDCMVALPGQLFYATQIPACVWLLAKERGPQGSRRERRGEVLFIDARELGQRMDRTHRELTAEDIQRVASTYHAWRGDPGAGDFSEVPGFCRAVTREEIAAQGYTLTPGRYVGAQAREREEGHEPFSRVMPRLVSELEQHLAEAHRLEQQIRESLRRLSHDG
ncbi:MAG TPA: class I SAM-dependent DNA methyltransferase [Myxococcaceae bacterium]|jgi:type I restriction enzyme M protein